MNKKRQPWFCQDCRDVLMEYDENLDIWKCPKCKVELWYPDEPDETENEIAALMEESYTMHKLSETILPSGGRGNSSKSKRKKQLLQKPSTVQIYNDLAASSNKILRPKGRPKKIGEGKIIKKRGRPRKNVDI
jgi:phage FluMu protein Com